MREDITIEDYIYNLGAMKDAATIQATWYDIASIINKKYFEKDNYKSESYYRKLYKQMKEEGYECEIHENEELVDFFYSVQKQRLRARDERLSRENAARNNARGEQLLDIFADEIKRYEPFVYEPTNKRSSRKALCCLLSDIHYGISFNNKMGVYNPDIARSRLMRYATDIIYVGERNNINQCHIVLLGDLISGLIHSTIRIENKENVIKQTIEISEAIAEFLKIISERFEEVFVYNVNGNHSRLTFDKDETLNGERLDVLIPWYCKTKLERIASVHFIESNNDTYSIVKIMGNNYVAIHGDMDYNSNPIISFVEKAENIKLSGVFAAHTHCIETKMTDVDFVRNGCLCGSGDEYCMKKRLFGVASQVMMIISELGIESIHPIKFREEQL